MMVVQEGGHLNRKPHVAFAVCRFVLKLWRSNKGRGRSFLLLLLLLPRSDPRGLLGLWVEPVSCCRSSSSFLLPPGVTSRRTPLRLGTTDAKGLIEID
jgi:hypothetical protein